MRPNDPKPFLCRYCVVSYTTKRSFKRHEKIHLDVDEKGVDKTYQCSESSCGKVSSCSKKEITM